MPLIAPFAQVARSTNRSTPTMAITGDRSQNVTADRARYARATAGERHGRSGLSAVLHRSLEEAVAPGPQGAADLATRKGMTPAAAAHRRVGFFRSARASTLGWS